MNRLWSRVGVRSTSVGLLVLGIIGGVYLGQDRAVQQRSAQAQLVVQSDADDMQLLKQRESEHAAARAWRNQAEGDAAAKAAAEAQAAAERARTLEQQVIAKKAVDAKAKKDQQQQQEEDGTAPSKPYTGPIPESCSDYTGNRAVGCSLMLDAGFKIDQFPCLDKLFKKESGWNQRASNAGSGAYGIPQALPGSKMAKFGSDWKTNPVPQIKWGLDYIAGRYGTPCGAWSHSVSTGWY